MNLAPSPQKRSQKGFSLIEIIAALALMALIVGGVFGIANGVLTLTRATHESRIQEIRLTNLIQFLRTSFQTIPVTTTFELRSAANSGQEFLVLEKAHGAFNWNGSTAGDQVSLIAENTAGKDSLLRLVLEQGNSTLAGTESRLPLIAGIKDLEWRAYDTETKRWYESWDATRGRPHLLELQFQLPEDPGPRRHVFALPIYRPVVVRVVNPEDQEEDPDQNQKRRQNSSRRANSGRVLPPR